MAWKQPIWNGAELRSHRERRGWSQPDAIHALRKLLKGKLADISQPTYSNWENGVEPKSYAQIQAIAHALGIKPGDLFRSTRVRERARR